MWISHCVDPNILLCTVESISILWQFRAGQAKCGGIKMLIVVAQPNLMVRHHHYVKEDGDQEDDDDNFWMQILQSSQDTRIEYITQL